MDIQYKPIGIIHSPYKSLEGMPIQSGGSDDISGEIEIYPEFQDGLKDLEGFSHIYAIYHFHKSTGWNPLVTPFLDDQKRGVFSTRAPRRPNPLGLSVFEVSSIKKNILQIRNVDVLDGTPLLDIKPYVPQFENIQKTRIGWLEKNINQMTSTLADDRFAEPDDL